MERKFGKLEDLGEGSQSEVEVVAGIAKEMARSSLAPGPVRS